MSEKRVNLRNRVPGDTENLTEEENDLVEYIEGKRQEKVDFNGPVFFTGKCPEEVQEIIDYLEGVINKLDEAAGSDEYRYFKYSSDKNYPCWNIVRNLSTSDGHDSFGLFNDYQHNLDYVCHLLYFRNVEKRAIQFYDQVVDLERRITYGDLNDKEYNAKRRGYAIKIMKSIIDEIDFSKVKDEIDEWNEEER